MRQFLLVAALLSAIGMTSALADNPDKTAVEPAKPKAASSEPPTIRNAVVLAEEEKLELLEAQRQVKKGYLKLAELDVEEAKRSVASATKKADVIEAKQELETAKAQVEIKSGELKELDVKIKYAKKRLDEVKAVAFLIAKGKELESCGLLMGVAGFRGTPLLAGISRLQLSESRESQGPKIAVFNMAYVMKHYDKAKFKVVQLNEEKAKLSVDLTRTREDIIKLQREIQTEQNPGKKEELAERQRQLTRKFEDTERMINMQLNEKSSAIIGVLYDEIKSVVDKLAADNGYDVVFAYPDATTPEEVKSTYIKELKLKPPAAQPFVLSKRADLTDAIIKELNERYPPNKDVVKREAD